MFLSITELITNKNKGLFNVENSQKFQTIFANLIYKPVTGSLISLIAFLIYLNVLHTFYNLFQFHFTSQSLCFLIIFNLTQFISSFYPPRG